MTSWDGRRAGTAAGFRDDDAWNGLEWAYMNRGVEMLVVCLVESSTAKE